VDIEAGAILTEELEPISNLIYVASWGVDIATNGTVIANCRTGDYVGEVTWVTGAPATAAAIARTACRCLFFNAHELRRLCNKSDAVKAALGASVAASVREKLELSNVAAAGRAQT
jgi:CRP-like cAMP-binding protein